MQKTKYLSGAVIGLLTVSLLASCQQGPAQPQKPAEEVIRDGMKKLTELTSYSYDIAFKGDMKDNGGQTVKFDLGMNGAMDIKDPKNPKFNLKFNGSGSDQTGMGGSANFDLRLGREAVYFNVMKLDIQGGPTLPAEFSDKFGKWWKIAVPPEMLDEMAKSVPQGEAGKLTPEQEKMQKLLAESNLFASPTYVGADDVKGEQSYHYSVTLDKKALVAFMKKVAEEEGTAVSTDEMAQAEEGLKMVEMKGDVWVGSTSGIVNQFSGVVTLTGGENEPSGSINVKVALGDVNKPVTVEAPADAQEFPMEELFGAMMGGMPVDDGSLSGMDTEIPADVYGTSTEDGSISQ